MHNPFTKQFFISSISFLGLTFLKKHLSPSNAKKSQLSSDTKDFSWSQKLMGAGYCSVVFPLLRHGLNTLVISAIPTKELYQTLIADIVINTTSDFLAKYSATQEQEQKQQKTVINPKLLSLLQTTLSQSYVSLMIYSLSSKDYAGIALLNARALCYSMLTKHAHYNNFAARLFIETASTSFFVKAGVCNTPLKSDIVRTAVSEITTRFEFDQELKKAVKDCVHKSQQLWSETIKPAIDEFTSGSKTLG